MLVKTFNEYELQEEFRRFDRDYFSLEGYQALLDFFEESDTNTELDVIAICCDFTEDSPENIIDEYDNIDDIRKCKDEDGNIDTDALLDILNYYTLAMDLGNGNFLYLDF